MKKSTLKFIKHMLCYYIGFMLIVVCPTLVMGAGQWEKIGRYENKEFGFSVEYDAGKLTNELPSGGPFIFAISSSDMYPSLRISVSPSSPEINWENIVQQVAASIPMLVPGSQIKDVKNTTDINLSNIQKGKYFEFEWTINPAKSTLSGSVSRIMY
jgi:hypothetical protein